MARDLKAILNARNVASLIDDDELKKIAARAVSGYESDKHSRSGWEQRNKDAMDLAMQIAGPKNFPFEGAANVKYPLLSVAAIQFSARAYPTLFTGWDIVKGKVVGDDKTGEKANKARRVETHMNYQLNKQIKEWEDETDRLLTVLPILGCCFKETYWSTALQRIVSHYVSPLDVVMHYKAESMETVPRITKKYYLYPNDIITRQRAGMFLKDFKYGTPSERKDDSDAYDSNDEIRPHLFLQQHTWIDLDGDDYAEPYVVIIHSDTKQVVRIAPRFAENDIIPVKGSDDIQDIKARQHFTKFTFMHSPDGGIYDLGFGSLLFPINETVDSTINALLDAANLNNSQAGFIGKNLSIGRAKVGGVIELPRTGLLPVPYTGDDLRRNIFMLNEVMKPPSTEMFNLLGFMVNAGEKLSVNELLTGEQSIQNEPATTSLARLEQGLKVFSAIFKRLHRSFSDEFKLLFRLNSEYLDASEYFRITDEGEQQSVSRADYDEDSCDIIPRSSPEDVSNTQKLIKGQALLGMRGQGLNDEEIMRRWLEAMQIADMETILKGTPPPPDPKLVLQSEELDLKRDQFEFDMMKFGVEMAKMRSEIILNLAKAEAAEAGSQIDQYIAQMDALISMIDKSQQSRAQGQKPAAEPSEMMASAGAPIESNGGAMMGEPADMMEVGVGG